MVAGQHALDDPMVLLCYVCLADEIVLGKNSFFDRRSVENLSFYVNLNLAVPLAAGWRCFRLPD